VSVAGIALTGLTGVGKSTVEKQLADNHSFVRPTTYVTRQVSPDEPSAYVQLVDAEFLDRAREGSIVLPFRFGKTWYGYDKTEWASILASQGRGWLFNVRPYAGLLLAAVLPAVLPVWLEVPEHLREARLRRRASERDRLSERLEQDTADAAYRAAYRNIVLSEDLPDCTSHVLRLASSIT
jgi:guanylate kinase